MSDHKRQKQQRKVWREDSRKRRKQLHIPESVQWGSYCLDFPTFDNPGIIELQNFIRELDNVAEWAQSRRELIADFMRSLHASKSPLEMITSVSSIFPASNGDMILLDSAQDLYDCLGKPFNKPLLHRTSMSGKSLCGRKLSLDMFWTYLHEQSIKAIDFYDYSVAEPSSRTQRMTVQEVILHWKLPGYERHAINLLDIENRIWDFCPTEVIQHDLSCKISRSLAANVGKTSSEWMNNRREFYLLSGANAISSIHVDNGAQLTWISILEGRKIWYFPRKITSESVRLLAVAGSQGPQGYEEGWARVELCPGNLLYVQFLPMHQKILLI